MVVLFKDFLNDFLALDFFNHGSLSDFYAEGRSSGS